MSNDLTVPAMGSGLWAIAVAPRSGNTLPLRHAPLTDGKGRLLATLQDLVVCLEEDDAGVHVRWEYPTGGHIPGPPAIAGDGSVRVHSTDGRLHGLSPEGKPLWPPVEVGEPLGFAAPLADEDGTTWICGYSGGLLKVDPSGAKSSRPFLRSPAKFDCAGFLHGGRLIVGGMDHFLHAIDVCRDRGAEVWEQGGTGGKTTWYINSAVALAGGSTFVVASADQHLYGFAPDGSELWKTKLPGQALGSPVVDGDERVYIGLSSGEQGSAPQGSLGCFDIKARLWAWQAPAHGPVESTPVIGSDGVVYFGDNAGCIQGIGATGKSLWQAWVGCPVRSAGTISNSGHVVFGDELGRLLAVQCSSPELGTGWPKIQGPIVRFLPATSGDDASRPQPGTTRAEVLPEFTCTPAPAEKVAPAVETRFEPTPPPPPPIQEVSPTPIAPPVVSPPQYVAPPSPPLPPPAQVQSSPEDVNPPPREYVPERIDPSPPRQAVAKGRVPPPLPPVFVREPAATSPPPPPPEFVPLVPEEPVEVSWGRLESVTDVRLGTDVLALRGRPWNLSANGERERHPLLLANPGPGDLQVTVHCRGRGVSVSPAQSLKVRAGRSKFIVLNVEPTADEWLLLDFQTADSRPGKRFTVRIRRSGSPANR